MSKKKKRRKVMFVTVGFIVVVKSQEADCSKFNISTKVT
jgi:hypothetical protein